MRDHKPWLLPACPFMLSMLALVNQTQNIMQTAAIQLDTAAAQPAIGECILCTGVCMFAALPAHLAMSICSNIMGMFSATAGLHVLLHWHCFQAEVVPAEKAFRCCWQMEPAPWIFCARGLLKRCRAFCIAKQIKSCPANARNAQLPRLDQR